MRAMAFIGEAINCMLGRRSHQQSQLRAAVDEATAVRGELRASVSQMGQEVWGMVETGDPLAALAHSARKAQFHQSIASGQADE